MAAQEGFLTQDIVGFDATQLDDTDVHHGHAFRTMFIVLVLLILSCCICYCLTAEPPEGFKMLTREQINEELAGYEKELKDLEEKWNDWRKRNNKKRESFTIQAVLLLLAAR
jgi:hypothetical protein